jgi:hypothetical protein
MLSVEPQLVSNLAKLAQAGLALGHDGAPLTQVGRALFAVEVSADVVAFPVEVIVDHYRPVHLRWQCRTV